VRGTVGPLAPLPGADGRAGARSLVTLTLTQAARCGVVARRADVLDVVLLALRGPSARPAPTPARRAVLVITDG
jgi:hypothetical protein